VLDELVHDFVYYFVGGVGSGMGCLSRGDRIDSPSAHYRRNFPDFAFRPRYIARRVVK
jgi:hypothetical protein